MPHQGLHSEFRYYKSYKILKALAENPIDLTNKDNLNSNRIQQFCAQSGEFKLLYATERVTGDVLLALQGLSLEANLLEKMHAMQAGEIINKINHHPSEQRAALHTAIRDLFQSPNPAPNAKAASKAARAECAKLKEWCKQIDKHDRFTDLIQVGIGGSHLGPRALYHASSATRKKNRRVHFVSNVDPDQSYHILRDINPKTTLVVVVSKSGTTLETLTNEAILRDAFIKAGCDPKEHFIGVTQANTPMDDAERFGSIFYMLDSVGGRYSATSMAGGVMLAFAIGIEGFLTLLKGAHEMDLIALEPDFFTNLPLLGAMLAIWNRNFLYYPTAATIPYSHSLAYLPSHLQQCEMESNGKRIDKNGIPVDFDTSPVAWGAEGTDGQHAFYQLLHQGTQIVPVEFIGFALSQGGEDFKFHDTFSQEKLLASLFAQALALAQGQKHQNPNQVFPGNRPSHILLAKQLDLFTLGSLFAYYEHKIVFQGLCWNINPFDQEGVELGKQLTMRILESLTNKRTHKHTTAFPEATAFMKHLMFE